MLSLKFVAFISHQLILPSAVPNYQHSSPFVMVNNSSINSSAKHSVSAQAPKRHCAVAKNSQPESSLHNLEGLNSQTASIISPDPQNLTAPVKDLRLRSYQERIVKEGVKHNTLIVLPTGSGKTLIAAEAIRRVGTPAIFFVPTVLLVEQQKKALESWTGLDVHPYAGGMYLPPHFDILVSTPKAFEDAQVNLGLDYLQWNRLKCVVFDEVHHALKDHPYRKLALSLRDSCVSVRVLGLTASYTYAVGEKKIKTALQRLCDELQITNLQTAAEEELRSAGYHASSAKPESPPPTDLYEIPPGVVQPSLRRPHLMLTTFLKRVEVGQATQLSSILTKTVLQMEMAAAAKDPSFLSPVQRGKGVKQWGVYAHACAAQARDTYHFGMYSQLESWYEALRLMVVSWEEADFAAITFLRMCGCDSIDGKVIWPPPVADCIRSFWSASPTSFGRLNRLRSVLLEKVETLDQFRGLIFVQQRVTTHILEYYISKDPELSRLFSTACLYASSKPATPSLNVTKAQTAAKLRSFATGAVNLLITTVVAEEGMDLPAANCVIRFDAMQHAVSLVQGRGRARQEQSSFVVLSERAGRSASALADTERQQLDLIRNFKPESLEESQESRIASQKSREIMAKNSLYGLLTKLTAMSRLNVFSQKTKTHLRIRSETNEKGFVTTIHYKSALRNLEVRVYAANKKASKQDAALQMVLKLRQELENTT